VACIRSNTDHRIGTNVVPIERTTGLGGAARRSGADSYRPKSRRLHISTNERSRRAQSGWRQHLPARGSQIPAGPPCFRSRASEQAQMQPPAEPSQTRAIMTPDRTEGSANYWKVPYGENVMVSAQGSACMLRHFIKVSSRCAALGRTMLSARR